MAGGAKVVGGLLERHRLRRRGIRLALVRGGLPADRGLSLPVEPLEVAVVERPAVAGRILLLEPALVLAQQDVRVDQRAAAKSGRDEGLEVAEGPRVEEPV